MLTDWLAWLDETQRWVETTASDESDLALSSVSHQAPTSVSDGDVSRADLSTLFEAMTALRQDVTLQTRSARRDREQASETLDTLSAAVDQLRREAEAAASETLDTVHVDVLLDLHDALRRAERQASQVIAGTVDTLHAWCKRSESGTDDVTETVPEPVQAPVAEAKPGALGRWRRWFGGASTAGVEAPMASREAMDDTATVDLRTWLEIGVEAERMANRLTGLVTGYQLSLQRLERTLTTCGIEPISCLGQAVDPELMEVVQVLSDATQPAGIVMDEVRCGYRRHGQIYRFAQVVATRSDATPSHPLAEDATDGPGT